MFNRHVFSSIISKRVFPKCASCFLHNISKLTIRKGSIECMMSICRHARVFHCHLTIQLQLRQWRWQLAERHRGSTSATRGGCLGWGVVEDGGGGVGMVGRCGVNRGGRRIRWRGVKGWLGAVETSDSGGGGGGNHCQWVLVDVGDRICRNKKYWFIIASTF